jgi:hypothetical protein
MRRRRFWTTALGILVSMTASLVYAAWPGRSTFTVGEETTYVTGPLDKHGYVDYVAALNERLRKDITPENNANVLIWQALGPRPEGGRPMPPEYFQWLGIESPPEQGDYLVSWQNYLKEHLKSDAGIDRNAFNDRLARAAQWPWTAKEEPELADWLHQSEKPLALVKEATGRPDYYNPLVPRRTDDWSPGLIAALLPSAQRCREVAAALTCRAMLRVTEGKVDEAWQDLLACHRLGRLVARGGGLIEFLAGIAIDAVASKADLAFLDHAKLESKQVLVCLEDLRKLPPMPAVADKMDSAERFMLLDTMMLTARHGLSFLENLAGENSAPPKGNSFKGKLFTRSIDWDPAYRIANSWYDRCVTGLRLTDRTARLQEMAAFRQDLMLLKQQVASTGVIEKAFMGPKERGEMIGNVLITLMLPAYDKVQGAADRCEQGQRNLHLAFALAAYHRDHGRYPAELDELAPKYLEKVPDDLFSSEPLIYRLEDKGYLLYSVGPNGTDEGGRGYDDAPRGDDLGVRMPVPEPQATKKAATEKGDGSRSDSGLTNALRLLFATVSLTKENTSG